ncbi:ubiquitin carboxyl-terminal hydrolase 25-like isoform X2 [Corticium candelabrum]|uniref:ubiquitin carboxyl-terminal hydrolase 25-like isoform X2 n=1 Tax=Corticium candelabrum TaxID=121492 RepID=UPI002E254B2B|nr:ubiquitin carboxyl-terminal hydrolase 25-like isoform X2 [Corticium candelabrum]
MFQPVVSRSGISQEDEEISRALEESIAANQDMARRGRIDPWMMFADPLNPHERTRQGDTPVGLKNVGNTCWFSAVIQSLFHLPIVRKHILSYKMPALSLVPSSSSESDQALARQNAVAVLKFMEELRILFSLLVGSKRKYVNPQKPVEILKSAFIVSSSQFSCQQDVSEFNHKLLEWLQDAFHLQQLEENSKGNNKQEARTEERNPVVRLFYGKCKTEGINEGKSFDNECFFTSLPVQVQGHHDLHSCLEASLVHREIEPVSSSESTCLKAEQEMWFLQLPPILTIELSRFEFNQTKQKAEKIHDKLTFSRSIFMDRYLECNKVDVTARRDTVYKLRRKLDILERQLDKFTSYKSKRVALQDVFDLALGFAHTKRMRSDDYKRDEDVMETSPQTLQTSVSQNAIVVEPCPRHVTEEELKTLQTCLTRWRKEVDEDQLGLREDINEVVNQINEMYNDPSLTQVLYELYAVLVHEGEAAGGHYWAYIRPNLSDIWLKFNDISVIEVTWDEVERESMGEHHTASAYCLIYVDHSKQDWIVCNNDSLDLPPDLQIVVDEDNEKLQEEIREYDKKQEETQSFSLPKEVIGDLGPRPDVVGQEKQPSGSNVNRFELASEPEHPQEVIAEEQLRSAVEIDIVLNPANIDSYVSEIFTQQHSVFMSKFTKQVENFSFTNDTRLLHLCCYMMASNAPQVLVDLAVYEAIVQEILLDAIPSSSHHAVQNAAYRKMRSLGCTEDHAELKHWKHYYEKFCETAAYFVKGLDYLSENSYAEALTYVMKAFQLNNHLTFPSCPAGSFDINDLAKPRQHCLKVVNQEALNLFVNFDVDNIDKAMRLIRGLIIPCFSELERSSLPSDLEVKEEVREAWCSLVSGDNLGENRQERLQEVLEKLFDVSSSRSSEIQTPPIPRDLMKNLFRRYNLIVAKFQQN